MTNAISKQLDLTFLPDPIRTRLDQAGMYDLAYIILGGLTAVYFFKWLVQYLNVLKQVRGLPAIHSAIEVFEAGHRSALPHIPGLIPARDYTIDDPWKKYAKAQSDLIACTQATTPYAVYLTSSPSLALSVSAKPAQYLKPTSMFRYVAIDIFGRQIVSAQTGSEHKRHKGVVKGCFNETIMRGVWEAMVSKSEVMWAELGLEEGGVWKDIEGSTVQLTLLVIGQIGFGQDWPWTPKETDGRILSLDESLYVVTHSMFAQLVLPLWLLKYNPFSGVRRLAKAQISLIHHIKTMIARRGAEIQAEQNGLASGEKIRPPTDVLGAIVASQMDVVAEEKLKAGEEVQVGLTPEEIVGNVWIFIVAGHETSAHVIGFTLAYLALYPEHQDKILHEIDQVTGGSLPTYRDMPSLKYTLACIHESIRLRDIVMTLPKLLAEDVQIPYTTWDETGRTFAHTRTLKKGSHLIIDSPACQLNPFTWSDPMTFNPDRMLDDSIKNMSTGFSSGQRACIGKRFAEVEIVAFITHMVKQYKFEPVPKEGESRENMEKRYLAGAEVLNLTPGKWDLKMTKMPNLSDVDYISC